MFNFNTFVDGVKEVYSFWGFLPNWFDVLSFLITIAGLWFAYRMGERGYQRDRKDKKEEQEKLAASEVELLRNSLKQLLKAASKQIEYLKDYEVKQNFTLKYRSDVQVDFLKFIDVKNVYEYYGPNNEDKVKLINELFSSLFSLSDFRDSLRDSVRTAMNKYNMHEQGFYLYRKLMYRMLHEIANRNAQDIERNEQGVLIDFGDNDFARQFSALITNVFANPDFFDDRKNVVRPKVKELLVLPVINLCQGYIPDNPDAIEASDVANEVNASWINMLEVLKSHFVEVRSHIEALEAVEKEIKSFLELERN